MFALRLKLGSVRNNEWRCCFCFHVRTATIVFGIWHLVLHILALTVLALIMRNHHVIVQKHEEFEQNDFLPTPLSKIKDDDNPYYLPTTQDGHAIYSMDIDMGALMTICTLSITLLMVYGAIKGKATHLLPFFCLQLFDFAITTLTATGYFCYLRSVHRLVAEHWNLPFRQELLQLSPQVLSLIVLTAFLVSMLWKAYWIGIVWRCYKYLTLRQQTMRNTIHYILPGERSERANDPDYPVLFQDNDPFGSPMKLTPPPSYQDIMDDQPPPYPAVQSQVVQETPNRLRLVSWYGNGILNPPVHVNVSTTEEDRALNPSTSRVETNVEVNDTNAEASSRLFFPESVEESRENVSVEEVKDQVVINETNVTDGNEAEKEEGATALPTEIPSNDSNNSTPNSQKI